MVGILDQMFALSEFLFWFKGLSVGIDMIRVLTS